MEIQDSPSPGDALQAVAFFRDLDRRIARRYAGAALWTTAEPGQVILDYEDQSNDMFFVVSGTVRVMVRTPGGRELILDHLGAGQFFGEMAAIDGAPRSAAVIAEHRSRICRMRGRAFMELLAEAPELGRDIMRVLVARVRDLNGRLLDLTTMDGRHRIVADLLRKAGPANEMGERIISPPPIQQILANRIGVRRELVSREIAALIRQGVIVRRRGALVIRQPEVLARALADARQS